MGINTADGSKILRTYALESTPGVAPASAYQTMRVKAGVSTDFTRNTFASQELRSDRQISSLSYGTKQGALSLPVEWSYGTFDDFLEAVLGGTWTGDVLKIGNAVRTFSLEETTLDLSIVERFRGCQLGGFSISQKLDGTADGTITGVYRDIRIAQTTGVNLAYDADGKTITRASAGFITNDGWAVGDGVLGIGNTDAGNNNATPWVITALTDTVMTFTTATGMVTKTSTAGITLNLGSKATSVTPAGTAPPFDSFTGSITEGGATIGIVTGWDLNVQQDITLNFVLGSDSAQSASVGTVSVTGNISAYFVDEALRKKFANGIETSLSLVLGSSEAGTYTFDLGSVKYTSNAKSSETSAIIQTMAFTATYDEVNGTTLQITRSA